MKKPTTEHQNHDQKTFLWCNRRWRPLWLVTGKKRSISAIVPRFLAAIFRRQSVRLCGTVPAPWELFCAIFTQHRPHLSVGHISEQHTQSHHCRLAKPLNVFHPLTPTFQLYLPAFITPHLLVVSATPSVLRPQTVYLQLYSVIVHTSLMCFEDQKCNFCANPPTYACTFAFDTFGSILESRILTGQQWIMKSYDVHWCPVAQMNQIS